MTLSEKIQIIIMIVNAAILYFILLIAKGTFLLARSTFKLSEKKHKQDLFSLRFECYRKAVKVFGLFGLFSNLKSYEDDIKAYELIYPDTGPMPPPDRISLARKEEQEFGKRANVIHEKFSPFTRIGKSRFGWSDNIPIVTENRFEIEQLQEEIGFLFDDELEITFNKLRKTKSHSLTGLGGEEKEEEKCNDYNLRKLFQKYLDLK